MFFSVIQITAYFVRSVYTSTTKSQGRGSDLSSNNIFVYVYFKYLYAA
jgi:hypothetical protein